MKVIQSVRKSVTHIAGRSHKVTIQLPIITFCYLFDTTRSVHTAHSLRIAVGTNNKPPFNQAAEFHEIFPQNESHCLINAYANYKTSRFAVLVRFRTAKSSI